MPPGVPQPQEPQARKGPGIAACLLLLSPLLTSFCSLGLSSESHERILSHHPRSSTYSPAWAPSTLGLLCSCVCQDSVCSLVPSVSSAGPALGSCAVDTVEPHRAERGPSSTGQGWKRAGACEGDLSRAAECWSELLKTNLCLFFHLFPLPLGGRRCPLT